MRKLALVMALAALVLPAAASAKPPHPAKPATATTPAAPVVAYILRGTITAYAAANGATNGSVSILVSASNHHGASLQGKTLTFAVSSSTRVVLHKGAAVNPGHDHGIVKIRGAKALTDAAAQALVVQQIVDQG
jgi:hypothetical protein